LNSTTLPDGSIVGRACKSERGAHEKLHSKRLEMVFHFREILHAQEGQAVMPRVRARIVCARAALQVAHELQDAAEAERDAVLQSPHRLRPEDFGVPAGGLR
jgi:hypothetical protein